MIILSSRTAIGVLMTLCCLGSGCSLIPPELLAPLQPAVSTAPEAARQQADYLETGNPSAIRWILSHEIRTGMAVSDIDRAIGQEGQRVYGSGEMLRNSGTYREDDRLYRWGPDNQGQTYLLVFRSGKLVNFDAHQYNENKEELDWVK